MIQTVVHHLHIVTGTSLADPVAARLTIDLSSSGLENFFNVRPGGRGTTRHERRAITGTFFTPRNTRANKEETLGFEFLCAANRIGVVRVTTIADDVTLLELRRKLFDESIDSSTSLDKKDDFAGLLEL